MGLLDSAKSALSAARDMATEVLGEDGMEHLKSLKDDVVQAGGQVGQFAREVLDDCDNDALDDAKEFYTRAYDRGRTKVRTAREKARIEREARERERLALRAKRLKMLRKAAVILICAIFAAILIISGALWLNQRSKPGKEDGIAPAVSVSPVPDTAETLVPDTAPTPAPAASVSPVPTPAIAVSPVPAVSAAPSAAAPTPAASVVPSRSLKSSP